MSGDEPFKLSGFRSGIVKQELVIVKSAGDWQKLWERHCSREIGEKPPLPKVDFDRYVLVAAFAGSKPTGGYSVSLTGRQGPREFSVTATLEKPAKGEILAQAFTYPFAMEAFPRSTKPMRVRWVEKQRR